MGIPSTCADIPVDRRHRLERPGHLERGAGRAPTAARLGFRGDTTLIQNPRRRQLQELQATLLTHQPGPPGPDPPRRVGPQLIQQLPIDEPVPWAILRFGVRFGIERMFVRVDGDTITRPYDTYPTAVWAFPMWRLCVQ